MDECEDESGDDHRGDYWNHVAFDPEHKLVLAVIPGARTEENAHAIVAEEKRWTGGDPPPLMTSDEYPAYATAIEEVFGEPTPPPTRRGPGRPRVVPQRRLPGATTYPTVHKSREGGRVVAVESRLIFGSPAALEDRLGESSASRRVNTSFVERQNASDRYCNARKARKTYRFSKDWKVHEAMTCLMMYGSNFCRSVRTLRIKDERGRWRERSPATYGHNANRSAARPFNHRRTPPTPTFHQRPMGHRSSGIAAFPFVKQPQIRHRRPV